MAQTDVTQTVDPQPDVILDEELDLKVQFTADWESIAEFDFAREDLVGIIARRYRPRIGDIIQNVDGLSVFDVNAILMGTKANWCTMIWSLIRLALCMVVEILFLITVCYRLIKERLISEQFCRSLTDSTIEDLSMDLFDKACVTLISVVLTFKVRDLIRSRMMKGMYFLCDWHHAALPSFMDPRYVKFGCYFAAISRLMVLLSSYIVILSAEDAVNVVLNVVALLCIGELHYFMVEKEHYVMLKMKFVYLDGGHTWIVHKGFNWSLYHMVHYLSKFVKGIAYIAPFLIFWCH